MGKELVFNNGYNDDTKDKYYFQKDKNPININEVDIKKIVLSNKIPYGEQGANKYYIAYLNSGFKPLYIITKNIKLCTNDMNVLANDNELLKYIEIWNKIESLFNKKFNKKEFHSKPVYNNNSLIFSASNCFILLFMSKSMTMLILSISSSITFKVGTLVIRSSYIAKSGISCFIWSDIIIY